MPNRSTRMNRTVFRQICELIPPHLVPVLAREHGVRSRSFSPWSHLESMLYAQFATTLSCFSVHPVRFRKRESNRPTCPAVPCRDS